MDQRIWIIIPVYNRKEMTRACLESLTKQTFQNFQIIVVDDGSSDGTQEMIEEQFPQVIVLKGDGNLFWTKATNLGVEEALKKAQDNDYILTLNDDVVVKDDYLSSLLDSASKFPRALIGSIAVSSKDKETITDGGVHIDWRTAQFTSLMAGKKYPQVIKDSPLIRDVDVLSGRGTLIPVEVFKKNGAYNENQLPHYAADYEFSVRAQKAGYSLFINYEAVVISSIEATGLNNEVQSLRWKDFFKSFVSKRSPNNLYYRWNFSQLCCPGLQGILFYLLDVIRVVLGSFRRQILLGIK